MKDDNSGGRIEGKIEFRMRLGRENGRLEHDEHMDFSNQGK